MSDASDPLLSLDERALRQLVRAHPGAVWVCDDSLRVVFANHDWHAYTGWTIAEVNEKGWGALLPPEDLPTLDETLGAAIREGRAADVEFRFRRRDGVYRWFLGRFSPVKDEQDRVVQWVGSAVDIDDRKRVEAQLRAVLEEMPVGVVLVEAPTGRVSYANARVNEIFGDTGPAEDLDDVISRYRMLHPDGRAYAIGDLPSARVISRGEVVRSEEVVLVRPDGTRRWLGISAAPLRDMSGAILCSVSTIQDVTARVENEERARQSQKLEALGQLAGGIAHDANNQMAVVLGFAELLGRGELTTAQRRDVTEIRRAAERTAALAGQLLAFGRRQVLRTETVDLHAAVREVHDMISRLLGGSVELALEQDEEPLWVSVDRTQLTQVLVNLAVNARDAMPHGGTLTITTRETEDGRALMTFEDTGIGMDEATKARIFEPFFTTKPLGVGTGLGLAVVEGIVAQSGGVVTVDSTPGAGTTFYVRLPTCPPPHPRDRRAVRTVSLPGRGETILVVDDEAGVREVMSRALSEAGYRVIEAADGPAALHALDTAGGASLLVTDLAMPGMGGVRLTEAASERWPRMRALLVSGHPLEHGVDAGRAAFLQKPFTPDTLVAAVRRALSQGRR
jgi:two-component system cell cycle sensor histidine kinase/response regulator CckA